MNLSPHPVYASVVCRADGRQFNVAAPFSFPDADDYELAHRIVASVNALAAALHGILALSRTD